VQWEPYRGETVVGDVRVLRGELDRDLYAYLPPAYAETSGRFPVLYMHDGLNLFDEPLSFNGEWRVDETMEALAPEGIEAIVVGVPHGEDRLVEYVPAAGGAAYIDFLVDRVKPLVDSSLRTAPGHETTGLAGSSLGGTISLYGFLVRNDVFSFAGVMSPALWFDESLFALAEQVPRRDGRIWLDVGGREDPDEPERNARYVEDYERMASILRRKGYGDSQLRTRYIPDARHHESAWAVRLPDALRFLLPVAG
jgi:predicted alpha/beta superfamily hydrolase